MFLAVRDVVLFQAGYPNLLEGLRDLGLDAVELALSRDRSLLLPESPLHGERRRMTHEADALAFAAVLRDARIRVPALMVASNFNAEDVDAEVEWVAAALQVAGPLGARVVRVDAAMTGQKELPLNRRVRAFTEVVTRTLAATEGVSAILAVETHGSQGTDPEWLQQVLDAVASPRLAVALDPANYYLAGQSLDEVYALVTRLAPRVVHTHCKNLSFLPAARNAPRVAGWGYGDHVCPLPDGDIDFHRVARALYDAGYHGALCLEEEALGKFPDAARRDVLRRDVDYMRAALRALPCAQHTPA